MSLENQCSSIWLQHQHHWGQPEVYGKVKLRYMHIALVYKDKRTCLVIHNTPLPRNLRLARAEEGYMTLSSISLDVSCFTPSSCSVSGPSLIPLFKTAFVLFSSENSVQEGRVGLIACLVPFHVWATALLPAPLASWLAAGCGFRRICCPFPTTSPQKCHAA